MPRRAPREAAAAAAAAAPEAGPAAAPAPPAAPEPCDALIVGAGPAGLGAALLLAQRQGWERIVLLERRESITTAEMDKSYVYMIDGRGRALTDEAGVSEAVAAAGVSAKAMNIMMLQPDGSAKKTVFKSKDDTRASVWLPRPAFLSALHSGLEGHTASGRVRLLHATSVTSIHLAPASSASPSSPSHAPSPPITVHAHDASTGTDLAFAPRLLIGADGMSSNVREALAAWAATPAAAASGLTAQSFTPVALPSPAAGLRYKVLPLPPNPPFRKGASAAQAPSGESASGASAGSDGGGGAEAGAGDGACIANDNFASIVGVAAPRRRRMRLGLLPVRDPAAPRTANIIAPPDHEFWGLTTGEAVRDFLQASFPQLDIPALFSPQQLAAAAASRGGAFPPPQYTPALAAVVAGAGAPAAAAADSDAGRTSGAGVVLLGDAAHCFPPDLGQGVNSAMTDVRALVQALDAAGGSLAAALPAYQAARAPEARALAELMTFSFPWQYNQDRLGRFLWTINVMLRTALSAAAPALFSPHSFMLVQRAELSYAQVLERVHATTRRIWALGAALAALAAGLLLRAATAAAGAA